MTFYPVFLNLEDVPVLVAGGGKVAERKVNVLLSRGAQVRVVARDLTEGLRRWVAEGRVAILDASFREDHLEGVRLVFAATDDRELNRRVSASARARGIWVNAVDQPEDCDFIVPAVVSRGPLQVAVSTSGRSPAMAARIRKDLEDHFGPEYGPFLDIMGQVREAVLGLGLRQEENQEIFEKLVRSELLRAVGKGNKEDILRVLREVLPPGVSMDRFRIDLQGAGIAGQGPLEEGPPTGGC